MPGGFQSRRGGARGTESETAVSACRTRPGRLVFIESGNTDGWIATDVVVDVTQ